MQLISSHQRVFVHGGAATPNILLNALVEQSDRLRNVEMIHLHTEGPCHYSEAKYSASFRIVNLFVGANLRSRLDYDRIDYLPCLLSEVPNLLRFHRPIDVALVHLSPPDEHGYCSLGVSVDVARAAVDSAKILIAQINPQMPRTHGDSYLHIDELDAYVEVDMPIPEILPSHPPSEEERRIGRFVASLVEDGSTLQVGIGAVPDAVLAELKNHRRLGVHSEMWSDGILNLIEAGAVDNSQKIDHPGKCVSGFLMGSKKLYDFVNNNPFVVQLGADYVNNPQVICRNPKVVAINSAVEMDLTGQVCADSVGRRIISGVGGQMDFMRGASLSAGGRPIIAMTSRTLHGAPRIVSMLKPGAGVVTTRAHVHSVVTEYGIAQLFGKTLSERAKALIDIAHPEDRSLLTLPR